MTYAAAKPELVVEEEEIDNTNEEEQEGGKHVPVILSGYTMDMDLSPAGQPPSPVNTDLPTPASEVSIEQGANLEGSPDPPPVWREPCDNVLSTPQDKEKTHQHPQEVGEEATEDSGENPGPVGGETREPPVPVDQGGGEKHKGETQEAQANEDVSDVVNPSVKVIARLIPKKGTL